MRTQGVPDGLITPYGGELCDLMAGPHAAAGLRSESTNWPSWDLDARQLCDLELLLNGGFSPLRGFMGRADYESVCSSMRLADGTLWPVPMCLEVSAEFASQVGPGARVALRDHEGVMLAALQIEDLWQPDLLEGSYYAGGALQGLQLPLHYDFKDLRATPAELRRQLLGAGWQKVAAFRPPGVVHRAEQQSTLRAVQDAGANLLIHPEVGTAGAGDMQHYARVRAYRHALAAYPPGSARLALLNQPSPVAGDRETLLQAIVSRNHGCTHLVVPKELQELVGKHEAEIGVQALPLRTMVFVSGKNAYIPEAEVAAGEGTLGFSEAQLGAALKRGDDVPEWFSFPEVIEEMRTAHPPLARRGFTVFFTGFSGSGKSTIANVLLVKLLEKGGRPVTLLDGDRVRKLLSSELGFSKQHRDMNIRRIGFVASEITKNGGAAICAPIAPYELVRREVAQMIGAVGGFILVHVSTPLEVCERRDRKGLYEKARAGIVTEFTGVSDPYEEPSAADLTIDTTDIEPEEAAGVVLEYLASEGYIGAAG
ncbi:MAG: adenylyl-sulfate kinase [Actinomycetota bacterium]